MEVKEREEGGDSTRRSREARIDELRLEVVALAGAARARQEVINGRWEEQELEEQELEEEKQQAEIQGELDELCLVETAVSRVLAFQLE